MTVGERTVTFSFEQVCLVVELPQPELEHIVELGIVEPGGNTPESWEFDADMLAMIRRASRLHQQLEVDWPGIALAMQLLDQVEQLQLENRQLRQRLDRFLL